MKYVYVAELEVDDPPFSRTDAPERGSTEVREAFVFHLRRVGSGGPRPVASAASPGVLQEVPPESLLTEDFVISAAKADTAASRREAKLVKHYCEYAAQHGAVVVRHRCVPPGESTSLVSDLYHRADDLLIEAKGSTTRCAIRMAIGQLFDYRRFFPSPPRLAVLLPQLPRADLVNLLQGLGIRIIYQNGTEFLAR